MLSVSSQHWQLAISDPFDSEASCVAPVERRDGAPDVLKLKLGMPHPEAEHEAEGLRFWNGDPTVRLLETDEALGELLLERCEPGTPLGEPRATCCGRNGSRGW